MCFFFPLSKFSSLEIMAYSILFLLIFFILFLFQPQGTIESLHLISVVSVVSNSMKEAFHGVVNILPLGCFRLHTFATKNMISNHTCCVTDSRCPLVLHPSLFHEDIAMLNARLWYETRSGLNFWNLWWDWWQYQHKKLREKVESLYRDLVYNFF